MRHTIVVWLLAAAFFGAGLFNAAGNRARVTGGLEIISAALIASPTSRGVGLALGAAIIVIAVVTIVPRREFSHAAPLGIFAALLVLAVTAL